MILRPKIIWLNLNKNQTKLDSRTITSLNLLKHSGVTTWKQPVN